MSKDDALALVTENRGRSKGRNSKRRGKSRREDECCHVANPYDEWVIDSAASYHVTPRREFFTSYKAGNLGRVKMGNKSYADIVGISDICVETNTGYTLKLKDVRHILDMRLNLISISVLDKEGYESHLGNAQDDSTLDLWHRRLAHMSKKGLQILAKKSLVLFAKEYVIRHEKTVSGTSQHNGVAERINRTIVEKVRCMLRMAKLPKSFWAEAVQTACYLINRSPSVQLDFDIPEIVWTREDASYAHLKKKKMIRSRDVVFHENENIIDFEKSEKSKSTIEGVSDLTHTSSSSDIVTDIEEVQIENYGDKPAGVGDTEGVEQGKQPIPPEMEKPQVRRSTRERRPSTRYSTSELCMKEMNSLHKNNTYELVELPKGKKALRNKWVFKLKKDASLDFELKQMDVKIAFLHGDLEEEIYMVQPEGFEAKGKEHKVCRLKKSLYGLKQALRQWYKKFDSFMVDDMLIVGPNANMVGSLKKELFKSFDMKDLGPARQILVSTPLGGHFKLSKISCPSSNKEKENMASIPYSFVVGSLMYAMVCTRLDIAHAVGVVSSSKPVLEGYTDADMAGDLNDRKSTSGFLFTLAGGVVSWQSKLQKCVALSTTEAEYIATTEAGKKMLWMKRFLQDLGLKQDEYVVHCDSQNALNLSKNSTYHSRTKHIDVRYHWLRLMVDQQLMQLRKIHTEKNPTDMLTKVVSKEKLELCDWSAGMNSS
uniref:Integrase catalytic domain-containing protein n=1 Tax=Fagus sylvatica TaxID=28930 RepID=A0A2N9EWM8_FAGSY